MKRRKSGIISGILVLLVLLTLISCGSKKEGEKNSGAAQTNEKPAEGYPVEVKNYNHQKQEITLKFNKAPEKIVAVYQSPIETLLALGLGDRIVLAAGLDDPVLPEYEAEFKKIKKYQQDAPSKEEVLGLNPDFITSWYSFFGDKKLGEVNFWIDRGINTYMQVNSGVAANDSLQNEYDDIINMGKIFKVENKAQAIVDNMKNEIEKAKKFVEGKKPVTVLILEVEKEGQYRIYGENSIGGEIASKVGANIVIKEKGKVGKEDILKANPDVIFTIYYEGGITKDDAVNVLLNDPGLQNLNAVKNKKVYPMVLSEVYATGVRTLNGIKTITRGLYPELYKN